MTALVLFLLLTALTTTALLGLRSLLDDRPGQGYVPPRSHETDEFAHTGSSWH
ncbi:hypothetical protein [Nocardioides sp. GY 10127]|uniref:hypothetical protein n=1 Tax=Nocardioides sp. GY 10127 TaxID=2569762 RepID=UPI001458B851|nr:hypothetical protein [Nocardioides sp. GY 10127]